MTPKPIRNGTRTDTGTEQAADVYVLGGGPVGAAVARDLQADGRDVAWIDESHDSSDVRGIRSDPTDVTSLSEAGLDGASTVIVASSSDSRNLLVAQLVRARFDVDRVLVLANDPDRAEVLADADHDPVCATTALADALIQDL